MIEGDLRLAVGHRGRHLAFIDLRAGRGPRGERMYTRLEREAWAAARVADRDVVTVHYERDGMFEDAIGVEVRSPVRAVSNAVPFSVTCATETPTGGASASGTVSASP